MEKYITKILSLLFIFKNKTEMTCITLVGQNRLFIRQRLTMTKIYLRSCEYLTAASCASTSHPFSDEQVPFVAVLFTSGGGLGVTPKQLGD